MLDQLCAMLGLTDPSALPDAVRKLKRAAELTADLDMVRYWAVDEHHARLKAAVEAAREAIK